jgi:hypothetical protein
VRQHVGSKRKCRTKGCRKYWIITFPKKAKVYCRNCSRERVANSAYNKKLWRTSSAHRERRKLYAVKYATTHARRNNLMRCYGLTLERFQSLLEAQKGVCALCFKKNFLGGKEVNLFVDHDHKTGAVRKLLCHRCNTMVGVLENNSHAVLKRALRYLRVHKDEN